MARKQGFDGGSTGTAAGGSFLTDGKINSLPVIARARLSSTGAPGNFSGQRGFARVNENQFGTTEWFSGATAATGTSVTVWGLPFQVSNGGTIAAGAGSSSQAYNATSFSTRSLVESRPGSIAYVAYIYGNQGTWAQHGAGVTFTASNTVSQIGMTFYGIHGSATNSYLWPTGSDVTMCRMGASGYISVYGYNSSGYGGYNLLSYSGSASAPTYQSNGAQTNASGSHGYSVNPLQRWDDSSSYESALIHLPTGGTWSCIIFTGNGTANSQGAMTTLLGSGAGYGSVIGLRVGTKNVYLDTSTGVAFVTDGAGTVLAAQKSVSGWINGSYGGSSAANYSSQALGNGYFMLQAPGNRGWAIGKMTVDASNNLTWSQVARTGNDLYVFPWPNASTFYANTVNSNNVLVVSNGAMVASYDFTTIKQLMV